MEDEIDIEDLIEEEQCVFTLTEAGYIKRTPVSEYAAQSKGGMGRRVSPPGRRTTVVDVFTASTHDYILFFTDTGKVYRKKGYQIPESGKAAKGTNLVNILADRAGRAGAGHDPLPGPRRTQPVPDHGHPERHGEAPARGHS